MGGKSIVAKFCTRTIVHGFPDWYVATNRGSKTVWTLILIGMMAGITYQTYKNIADFLNQQSVTKISYITTPNMSFPNVTVCDSGRFNRSYFLTNEAIRGAPPDSDGGRQVRERFAEYFGAMAYQGLDSTSWGDEGEVARMEGIYRASFQNADQINRAGYECQAMLKYCVFSLKLFDCCSQARPVLTDYGVCYRVLLRNRGTPVYPATQIVPGLSGGFQFRSVIRPSDRNTSNGSPSSMRIHLSEFPEPHDPWAVHVPPGVHAMIQLTANRRRIDPAARRCLESPPQLQFHQEGDAYSRGLCENDCMQRVARDRCGCAPVGFGAVIGDGVEICTPKAMNQCVVPLYRGDGDGRTDYSVCARSCQDLCEQTFYDTSISYARIADWTKEPGTKISMYFDSLKYKLIEEQVPTTAETLYSNVGGAWGLWSGVSMLGFVQCAYICACGHNEPDDDEEYYERQDVKKMDEKKLTNKKATTTAVNTIA